MLVRACVHACVCSNLVRELCLCADIDECDNGTLGRCGSSDKAIACHNHAGDFTCDCQQGYYFNLATCAG